MVSAAATPLHVIPTQAGRSFSLKAVKLDFKKRCRISGEKVFGSSIVLLEKGLMPAPNYCRPKPVLRIVCKGEKRTPSLPAPDNAFAIIDYLDGQLWAELFFRAPVGTTPFLRVGRTCCQRCRCCFGDAGLISLRELSFHSLPCFLAPRRVRFGEKASCCHSHPRWMAADDALLNISAPAAASRAWPLCLVDVRPVYSINHDQ